MSFRIQKLEKADKTNNYVSKTVRLSDNIYSNYCKLAQETSYSINTLIIAALKFSYNNTNLLNKNNNKNNNIPITIRIPKKLDEQYNKLAKNNSKSFNSILLSALEIAFEELEIDDTLF